MSDTACPRNKIILFMLYILLMVLPEEIQCGVVCQTKLLKIDQVGELCAAFLMDAGEVLLK